MIAQGENAWLFVGEEVISESVKAYLDFETKLKERLPREQRAKAKPTDISGGAMDGRFLAYAEVERLKNLPTKAELIATIARLIKQVRNFSYCVRGCPCEVCLDALRVECGCCLSQLDIVSRCAGPDKAGCQHQAGADEGCAGREGAGGWRRQQAGACVRHLPEARCGGLIQPPAVLCQECALHGF